MTPEEFSNQFDILYNNITSEQAPGLNEYEKSVFLTKAQSQLVNEYFNVRIDGVGGGYDGSQRRQYDFSSLITTEVLEEISSYAGNKIDKRSRVYRFPEQCFLVVNEILDDDVYQYNVIPVSYAEYQRLMLKPYAYPVKRAAWRLLTETLIEDDSDSSDSGDVNKIPVAEIIGRFHDNLVYQIRYVKTLSPIILADLSTYGEDLTILGSNLRTPCELPVECHEEILDRAVLLAKIAWQGGAPQAQRESD